MSVLPRYAFAGNQLSHLIGKYVRVIPEWVVCLSCVLWGQVSQQFNEDVLGHLRLIQLYLRCWLTYN